VSARLGGAARGSAGFTLLEVLIAFAILSVAVVAVIQGFAQGLRLLKAAGDHQQAVLLADQKVRELVIPAEGHDQGQEGTFDWDRTVTIVKAPDLERTPATRKWRVYQIDVKVRWGDRRGVEVVTLRTAADEPPQGSVRSSQGGLQPPQSGVQPLPGGVQPLPGGVRPSQGGMRPSQGGMRPLQGGMR
jgi:general secretion pathway protein I